MKNLFAAAFAFALVSGAVVATETAPTPAESNVVAADTTTTPEASGPAIAQSSSESADSQ